MCTTLSGFLGCRLLRLSRDSLDHSAECYREMPGYTFRAYYAKEPANTIRLGWLAGSLGKRRSRVAGERRVLCVSIAKRARARYLSIAARYHWRLRINSRLLSNRNGFGLKYNAWKMLRRINFQNFKLKTFRPFFSLWSFASRFRK